MVSDHTFLCFPHLLYPSLLFIALFPFSHFMFLYASQIIIQECQKQVENTCVYVKMLSVFHLLALSKNKVLINKTVYICYYYFLLEIIYLI